MPCSGWFWGPRCHDAHDPLERGDRVRRELQARLRAVRP
jgi:hypothetical protein